MKLKAKLLIALVSTIFLCSCTSKNKYSAQLNTGESNASSSTSNTASGKDASEVTLSSPPFAGKTALLLGLSSKRQTDTLYKTIYISDEEGKVTYLSKTGLIIAPYKEGFWELVPRQTIISKIREGSAQDSLIYNKYEYKFDTKYIVSNPAVGKSNFAFSKDMIDKLTGNTFAYGSVVRELLYVGNKYACIKEKLGFESGGTFRSSSERIYYYDISEINSDKKQSYWDIAPKVENSYFAKYSTENDKLINEEKRIDGSLFATTTEKIDEKDIFVGRHEGKWTAKLPVFNIFQHYGNGSTHSSIIRSIATPLPLPFDIKNSEALCLDWHTIKLAVPDAKDAVSSPDKSLLVVMTDKELKVYENPLQGLKEVRITVPIEGDATIIMHQWATGSYVEKWTRTMLNLLNK